jgi:hypothetical protein
VAGFCIMPPVFDISAAAVVAVYLCSHMRQQRPMHHQAATSNDWTAKVASEHLQLHVCACTFFTWLAAVMCCAFPRTPPTCCTRAST